MAVGIFSFSSCLLPSTFNISNSFLNSEKQKSIESNDDHKPLTVIDQNNGKDALSSSVIPRNFTVADVTKLLDIGISPTPGKEMLSNIDLVDFISGLPEEEFVNHISSLQSDQLRGFVYLLSLEERETLASSLSGQKLTSLVSALAIKNNFSLQDIDKLKAIFEAAQKELNNLAEANGMLSVWNLSKNFCLTPDEKYQIQEMFRLGENLINEAQQTVLEIQSALQSRNQSRRQQEELLKEKLLNCCKLVQLIQTFKKHEASIIFPDLSKPGWIKFLEYDFLNTVLNNYPNLITSTVGFLVLAGLVVSSALQTAILTIILTVSSFGFKTFSKLAVSGYENRYLQKTEDKRIIKEKIFATLNELLHKELDMSGMGGNIINKLDTHANLINQAGHQVGSKLDDVDKKMMKGFEELKKLASQNGHAAGGVEGASISEATRIANYREQAKVSFKGTANILRSALAKKLRIDSKEIDQILSSLIAQGLQQSEKPYDQTVKALKVSDETKSFLEDSRKGEQYWNSLLDLKNYYPDNKREEKLRKDADINPENIPAAYQSNLPPSNIVSKMG